MFQCSNAQAVVLHFINKKIGKNRTTLNKDNYLRDNLLDPFLSSLALVGLRKIKEINYYRT